MNNKLLFLAIILLICSWTNSIAAQKKAKKQKFNYLTNTKSVEEIKKVDNKLEKLYYLFLGEFSNAEQAANTDNPMLKTAQSLIAVPIWQERTGENWFYMGWFMDGKPEKALSQGIYKLSKENRDTFKLVSYFIPNEAENQGYSLEWQKEKPFANLTPKQVMAAQTDLCPHYIIAKSENEFDLLLDQDFCDRNISDVIKSFKHCATLTLEVNKTYTEFYDKNKRSEERRVGKEC